MKPARRHSAILLGRSESGTAALEFALSAPFLALALAATVEIGTTAYQSMQVQNAAEAGAVYASKHGPDVAGISNAVASATPDIGITATPPPAQFCGCPSASGVAATLCDTTCTGGQAPGYYVRITARINRTSLVTIGGPASPTIAREAVVRLY